MNLHRAVLLVSLCGLLALALLASACGSDPVDEGTAAPQAPADPTPDEYVGKWVAQPPAIGMSPIRLEPNGKLEGSYDCNLIGGEWFLTEPHEDGRRGLIVEGTAFTMAGCRDLSPAAEAQVSIVVDGDRMIALDADYNELFEYLPEDTAPASVAAELIVGEWRDDGPKRSFGWPFLKLRSDGTYKLDSASACGSSKGKWVLGEGETLRLRPEGSGFAGRDCVGHHWSIEIEEGEPTVSFNKNDILFKDADGKYLGSMERLGLEGNRSELITPSEVLGNWTSDSEDGFHAFTLLEGGKASGSLSCNTWNGEWWVDHADEDQAREIHFGIGMITLALCGNEASKRTTPFVIDGRPVALNKDGEVAFHYRRQKSKYSTRHHSR